MKKHIYLTILSIILFSCNGEENIVEPTINEPTKEEIILLLKENAINKINDSSLKYNLNKNSKRTNYNSDEIEFNDKQINFSQKIRQTSLDINFKNLPKILGSDYDEVYFKNIELIYSIGLETYNSVLLKNKSNEEKKIYIKDVFINLFENVNIDGINSSQNSTLKKACYDKALRAHNIRLGAAVVSAVIAGAFSFGIASASALIVGSISSGLLYDNDISYCMLMPEDYTINANTNIDKLEKLLRLRSIEISEMNKLKKHYDALLKTYG